MAMLRAAAYAAFELKGCARCFWQGAWRFYFLKEVRIS